jgi:hypothetical protein
MPQFTFQIETAYRAKRPQDVDCVGFLQRMRTAYISSHKMQVAKTAHVFGRRTRPLQFAHA